MVWNPVSKRSLSVSVRAPTSARRSRWATASLSRTSSRRSSDELVLVGLEGFLVTDRLRLAFGLDGSVVDPTRQREEMAGLRRPERGGEHRLVDRDEIGDAANPDAVQLVERDGSDAPQALHGKRPEKFLLATRLDDDHAGPRLHASGRRNRLGLDRGELGEELVRGHPDRARQRQFTFDVGADSSGDRRGGSEQPDRPGDVEECFVERQRLDQWREAIQDLAHLGAHLAVEGVVARQEHRVRDTGASPRPTASPSAPRIVSPRTTLLPPRRVDRYHPRPRAGPRGPAGGAVRPTRRRHPCRREGSAGDDPLAQSGPDRALRGPCAGGAQRRRYAATP